MRGIHQVMLASFASLSCLLLTMLVGVGVILYALYKRGRELHEQDMLAEREAALPFAARVEERVARNARERNQALRQIEMAYRRAIGRITGERHGD